MLLQKINNQKGFTLIELMIAIFVILILVAIAAPNFIALRDKQKIEITIQQKEVDEKTSIPPKQKEITEQEGEMNKL